MKSAQRGFSLIELMMAGAILALGLTGLSIAVVAMGQNRAASSAQITVGQEATRYLNEAVQLGYANLPLDIGSTPLQNVDLPLGKPGRYNLTVHVKDASTELGVGSVKRVDVTLSFTPTLGLSYAQTSSAYVSQ